MDITYLGHSSFFIKTKDVKIVTDPFGSDIGLKFPKTSADVVTISHDHGDHNKAGNVDDSPKVLQGPGEYEISGVSFIGVPSYHDDKKGEERGKNTIFVIEADGSRIVHLGDLGHKLKESKVDEIGEVDILMLPVGGVYTIGPKEAIEVAKSLDPKVIIPMHYKTNEHDQKTFGELAELSVFLEEMNGKVQNEKKYKVSSPDSLPEDDTIVVVLENK